ATEEESLLGRAEALAKAIPPTPAVPVHGDFWAGNVLAEGGRLAVVDWSAFHPGSAIEDLFDFVSAAVYRHRQSVDVAARSLWRVFFEPCTVQRLARAAATRTLAQAALPAQVLHAGFLGFLISRLTLRQVPAWQAFVARYVRAGMPAPFELAQ